jgi:hypothetical protein
MGLVSDRPTSIEMEMAHEAAVAVLMLQDSDRQYDISWRLVFLIVGLTVLAIGCMFYFLM